MEETSLIDFLKLEISYFRELLAVAIQEEIAIKDQALSQQLNLSRSQLELLNCIKSKRPQKFEPFNLKDDVSSSILSSLKDQLEHLAIKLKSQLDRNSYLRNLIPTNRQDDAKQKKIIVETLEEEC